MIRARLRLHGARDAPRQKVFSDGQVYDAFELLVSIARRAEREIVLVDGYVDAGKKGFAVTRIEDDAAVQGILSRLATP